MRKILIALMMFSLMTVFPATAQETFKQILAKSPRHHEWVKIRNGDRDVHSFVVYPRRGMAGIKAPVFGFYAGDDARVNLTVPRTAALMKEAGKTFDAVTYEGAGHAFMRRGEEPDPTEANKKARDEAWVRWLALLRKVDVR